MIDHNLIIVDPEFTSLVKSKNWNQNTHGNLMCKDKSVNVYLAHFVLPPIAKLDVDHINGNVFDNRKENLRIITRKANLLNHGTRNITLAGPSYIVYVGRGNYIGRFKEYADAVTAYDKAHKQAFLTELLITRAHNPHLTDEQYFHYAQLPV